MPPITNQNQYTAANRNSPEKSQEDIEHSVSISKIPPVSVTRDWADWGVWVFSGLLVIVGFLQVWLLYETLAAIQRQGLSMRRQTTHFRRSVTHAKRSADAAKKSADALVNSERAWITVNIRWAQGKVFFVHSTTIDGPGNTASETTGVDIDLLYANEGRSPAWLIEEKFRLEVVLSPVSSPSLDTEDAQFNERYEPVSVGQQSTNQHRMFGKGWNDSHAYVYGFVRYRDIFTPPPNEPRETWFGFRVNANGNIGRIVSYEYNRVT